MNEKVVDLFDKVIEATIIVISNPGEKVVNGFLQGMFEFAQSDDAFERTVPMALDSESR